MKTRYGASLKRGLSAHSGIMSSFIMSLMPVGCELEYSFGPYPVASDTALHSSRYPSLKVCVESRDKRDEYEKKYQTEEYHAGNKINLSSTGIFSRKPNLNIRLSKNSFKTTPISYLSTSGQPVKLPINATMSAGIMLWGSLNLARMLFASLIFGASFNIPPNPARTAA